MRPVFASVTLRICMIPVFASATLEICMIPVFGNVTLEDFCDTYVCQCYNGGFL